MSQTTTNGSGVRKTVCPIGRRQFRGAARPLCIAIEGKPLIAPVKEFSTGSFGFYLNDKTTLVIDGIAVVCQVGLNITVIGSKELPLEV